MTHEQWITAAYAGWTVFLFIVAALGWLYSRPNR